MLVVLPLLASNGTLFKTSSGHTSTISVFANGTALAISGTDPAVDVTTVPEDTKLGNTLYASNDPDAFNKVLVQVFDDTATATVTVDVDSDAGQELSTGGGKLNLTLSTTASVYQGVFFILDFATTAIDSILANDGDKITVTSKEGSVTVAVTLTVDGKGPVITETSPENKTPCFGSHAIASPIVCPWPKCKSSTRWLPSSMTIFRGNQTEGNSYSSLPYSSGLSC